MVENILGGFTLAKITIISGSPSASSRLNGLIQYIRKQLSQNGHSTALLEVLDLPPEDLVYANFNSPAILAAHELVEQADAVIIASPVYKASYTGVLKSYLDLLPHKALKYKTIMPVFVAGAQSHLLAIDYSLKPVLAAMGGRKYAMSVYATDAMITRTQDEQGAYQFNIDESILLRTDEAIEDLQLLIK